MQLYFKPEWKMPAIGAGSFVVGMGVGYFIATKRITTVTTIEEYVEYDVETTEDIHDRNQLAIDFARAAQEQPIKPIPVDNAPRWASDTRAVPEDAPEIDNVRDPEPEPLDEWDEEEEETNRSPDAPYVIHRREYDAGTTDYTQTSLEYFAADEVLCDQNRVPIYNAEKLVGRLEFGRGSGDSDTVFIRNETLNSEFEVTRNHGSYQVEVLGLDAEEEAEEQDLRHSNSMLKFRME